MQKHQDDIATLKDIHIMELGESRERIKEEDRSNAAVGALRLFIEEAQVANEKFREAQVWFLQNLETLQ